LVRLAWFGGVCGVWALAALLVRPRWFVRGTLAAALVSSLILAGAQAPLAALFLFASAWALGRLFALEGALALLAGLSLYSFLIGLAVHLPVNYPAVYAAAFAIPLAWQGRRLLSCARQVNNRLRQWEGAGKKDFWAAALLGFI
jgi:hypothetical protein